MDGLLDYLESVMDTESTAENGWEVDYNVCDALDTPLSDFSSGPQFFSSHCRRVLKNRMKTGRMA